MKNEIDDNSDEHAPPPQEKITERDRQRHQDSEEISHESPLVDQDPPKRESSRRSGCFKVGCVTLIVFLVLVGGFLYWVSVSLDPSLGQSNAGAKSVAKAAVKHLSENSHVESAIIEHAGADAGAGAFAEVKAHIKNDTTADSIADMLPSTCHAAQRNSIWGYVAVEITFSGNLKGTDINVAFNCRGSDSTLRANVHHDLTPAGEAKVIGRRDALGLLGVDYGEVTAFPVSLTSPSGSETSKFFTMNGWQVCVYSDQDGLFAIAVPLDQVVAAASQANAAGTVVLDLDRDELTVTGLVTDDSKGLRPEVAAPVVRAVADCGAVGLTSLKLNGSEQRGLSSDDTYWLNFTCQAGAWTPKHEGVTGQDEAEILQQAAEL